MLPYELQRGTTLEHEQCNVSYAEYFQVNRHLPGKFRAAAGLSTSTSTGQPFTNPGRAGHLDDPCVPLDSFSAPQVIFL